MNSRTVLIIPICLATPVLQTATETSLAQAGTSVLTVTSGLPNRGGTNPLGGAGVYLFRESFEKSTSQVQVV